MTVTDLHGYSIKKSWFYQDYQEGEKVLPGSRAGRRNRRN
ncbi:hypothetical protein HMPREF1548_02313 [Clostridium sp. KLE 1755]|nr:hypothetical protein HMPREF1548_02313 [Clostridium sp. KLE 1755]